MTNMINNQPLQTLKGFRDIFPKEKRQRDYVLNKILEVFRAYGFEPLETPALEYADLLLGKYGQEADQLVYTFKDRGGRRVGLRYDQTVPTARILAQYRYNLNKFFRRYQVQNVFRAENPQKGRYREFTQCDIDIFGSNSPIADAEIIACTYQAYRNIGFKQVQLKINDRQTLFSMLKPLQTAQINVLSMIQTIDKLDKKTVGQVRGELEKKGLSAAKANQALNLIKQAKMSKQLTKIVQLTQNLGVPREALVFTPTLARGLDYYTGMIFEVNLPNYEAGSCGGGGRYDQLIEQLGGVKMPAVGMAFGFARTVAAAQNLELIPDCSASAQILVTIFSTETLPYSLRLAQQLRQADYQVEVYSSTEDSLGKQLKLADQKQILWTVIAGPDEVEAEQVTLKNMVSGEQQVVPVAELPNKLALEEAVQKK